MTTPDREMLDLIRAMKPKRRQRVDYWSIPGFREYALAWAEAVQRRAARERLFRQGYSPARNLFKDFRP